LKPGSIAASLVALTIGKGLRLFLSPAILEGYTEGFPKFGSDPHAIEAFLRELKRAPTMVHPTQRITNAPDEPDNRFLECAQAARADYLVTGNTKHFPLPAFEGTRIVTPAALARTVAEHVSARHSIQSANEGACRSHTRQWR
jgi:predicted nucleic acid-binding protein